VHTGYSGKVSSNIQYSTVQYSTGLRNCDASLTITNTVAESDRLDLQLGYRQLEQEQRIDGAVRRVFFFLGLNKIFDYTNIIQDNVIIVQVHTYWSVVVDFVHGKSRKIFLMQVKLITWVCSV
jgi:hypothetical protein